METLTHIMRGLLGYAAFLGIAVLLSENRRAIPWKLVLAGTMLQFVGGFLVLHVDIVRIAVDGLGRFFVKILDFNQDGAGFLFGRLLDDRQAWGYLFAFKVLPTIIFFSALTSLLFYLGFLQKVVFVFAWVMSKAMKLSGAESLSASANIFLGQTEAPLLIKPYLASMTRSELMAVMVCGFASIAGAVLVAYIGMLGGTDEAQQLVFAKHLITASCMSAPAGLLVAKIIIPQTQDVETALTIPREQMGSNALEAVANGTTDGVKLAVNVGAMLIVFTAMVAMFNWFLGAGIGGRFDGALNQWIASATDGQYKELSLQVILGVLFSPFAWLMGVDGSLLAAGQVIGEKTALNEFIAYGTLGQMKAAGIIPDPRDQIILTYALCGFANIASIGIQIGGIGALAPNQRPLLAQIGLKAMIAGTIACFLTACVAGILVPV